MDVWDGAYDDDNSPGKAEGSGQGRVAGLRTVEEQRRVEQWRRGERIRRAIAGAYSGPGLTATESSDTNNDNNAGTDSDENDDAESSGYDTDLPYASRLWPRRPLPRRRDSHSHRNQRTAAASSARPPTPPPERKTMEEETCFDSSDSDECEDLFLGEWSEQLARGRRICKMRRQQGAEPGGASGVGRSGGWRVGLGGIL